MWTPTLPTVVLSWLVDHSLDTHMKLLCKKPSSIAVLDRNRCSGTYYYTPFKRHLNILSCPSIPPNDTHTKIHVSIVSRLQNPSSINLSPPGPPITSNQIASFQTKTYRSCMVSDPKYLDTSRIVWKGIDAHPN